MTFDAILFDKDGTLVDIDATWGPIAFATMHILAHDDPSIVSALVAACRFDTLRMRFHPDMSPADGSCAALAACWSPVLGRRDEPAFCRELDTHFGQSLRDDVVPLGRPAALIRDMFDRGLKLGLIANDVESTLRAQAAHLGLARHLDFFAGRDSGFGSKPGAGMVVAFAARYAISPERIAVVGDTMEDILSAHAAGAQAIAVRSGINKREDIGLHADHVIATIDDLPQLLGRFAA